MPKAGRIAGNPTTTAPMMKASFIWSYTEDEHRLDDEAERHLHGSQVGTVVDSHRRRQRRGTVDSDAAHDRRIVFAG